MSTSSHRVTGLWLVAFALLGLGIVQVYSSSYIFANRVAGDGLFFVKRQFLFAGISFALMGMVGFTPFRLIQKFGWWLWPLAGLGIAATFVPGLGIRAGGAARWINLPGSNVFEPAELIKVSLPLLLATLLTRHHEWLPKAPKWARWSVIGLVFCAPLFLIQKHLARLWNLCYRDVYAFCCALCFWNAVGVDWRHGGSGCSVILRLGDASSVSPVAR